MARLTVGLALFVLASLVSVILPQTAAVQTQSSRLTSPATITTKVSVDSEGAVHLLWAVHSQNVSGTAPGLWYSKYGPNGTTSIPPILIRNSSLVQSADMAVDKFDIPHIAWAEGNAFGGNLLTDVSSNAESGMYYVELNFSRTHQFTPTRLTGVGRIVVWPSVAVDDNLTTHFVWTQISGRTSAGLYYGTLDNKQEVNQTILIAEYSQNLVSVPRPRVAFDWSTGGLHVFWAETDEFPNGTVTSIVSYVKVDLRTRNITHVQVAKFGEQLEDARVTVGTHGNAYVVWEPENASKDSALFYISQIANDGKIVFVKRVRQTNLPTSTGSYVSVTADSEDNLYVVWYQPPAPPIGHASLGTSAPANISYIKIENDGSISETGNEVVSVPVIAVTISNSGNLYAIPQKGIIEVTRPTN